MYFLFYFNFFYTTTFYFIFYIQRKSYKNCRKLEKKISKITVYTIALKKIKKKQTNKQTDRQLKRDS